MGKDAKQAYDTNHECIFHINISIDEKRRFPAFAREPPPISLIPIFKIVPTAFCKTNTDFLQIYLQISDPDSGFV